MLFNSNLDRRVMKPLPELRAEVRQWEQDMAQSKKNGQADRAAGQDPAAYVVSAYLALFPMFLC